MAGGTKEAQKALLIKQKQVKYNYTFILPVHIDGKIKKEYEKKKARNRDISTMHQLHLFFSPSSRMHIGFCYKQLQASLVSQDFTMSFSLNSKNHCFYVVSAKP